MPRNLSAWSDLVIHLAVMLVMVAVLSQYNRYLAAIAFLVWFVLALFARERCRVRVKRFNEYCENVIVGLRDLKHYAMTNIPQAVMVVDENGCLRWNNDLVRTFATVNPEEGMPVNEFWDGILNEEIFSTIESGESESGRYVAKTITKKITDDEQELEIAKYFLVHWHRLKIRRPDFAMLTGLFIQEITA